MTKRYLPEGIVDTKNKPQRIAVRGLCDLDEVHNAHVFPTGVVDSDGNICMWQCDGQTAECRNCDDRKCMGCIFREYDHECKEDCPMCCVGVN